MTHTFKLLIILVLILLCSCLKFGENIHLSGKDIDGETIQRVERVSQLKLPKGTIHLNYSFFGDTIDPYWFYKGILAVEGYKEIRSQKEFIEFKDNKAYDFIESSIKMWWRPSELKNGIHKMRDFPNGSLSTYSIGEDENKLVIYISHHTM